MDLTASSIAESPAGIKEFLLARSPWQLGVGALAARRVLVAAAIGSIAMFATIFFGAIVMVLAHPRVPPTTPSGLLVLTTIGYAVTIPVVLLATSRIAKAPLSRIGFDSVQPLQWLGAVACCGAGLTVVTYALNAVIQSVFGEHQQDAIKMFHGVHTPSMTLLFFAMSVLGAPIAEEAFFRGLLFNALWKKQPFWIAATISGALFSSAHADVRLFVPFLIVGIALAGIYARFRNIYYNMGTHAFLNLVTGLILVVTRHR